MDARRWLRVVVAIPPGWMGRLPGELPRRAQPLQVERMPARIFPPVCVSMSLECL